MQSRWSIEKRMAHLPREICECLRARHQTYFVMSDERWKSEYGRATVEAVIDRVYLEILRRRLQRCGVQEVPS